MCEGVGAIDSGGSTPWGTFIEISCEFCLGQGVISDGELKAYNDAWKSAEQLASLRDELIRDEPEKGL